MNAQWQRRITWFAVLLLIVAALVYGFRPQPRLIETATAIRAPLQVAIEEEGKTRVIDRYLITAPVAGTTCRVDLNVGDSVDKDQILLTINPLQSQALDPRSRAVAEARVDAAEAALRAADQNVDSARADAELADIELQRLQPLAERGHISVGRLDQAAALKRSTAAALRSAEFAVDVAGHELEAARTALRYTGNPSSNAEDSVQVLAPVNGSILKLQHECEGVVSRGDPLLEIGDTRSLEIETDVLSASAVKIQPGMPVLYERWGGENALTGQVRRVEPVGFTKISALGVEEQRVLIISDITSPPEDWQTLGDGYRVESRFILWEDQDVLQIPASALFRSNGQWSLFVMQDNRARRRAVEVGQSNGLRAQILDGLAEGETVITHPDDTIEDGVRVKRRN
ncbi:membrane protein [Marinobacterium nitratireducens]|uniref:Membrane protein n=1 Tax=Marinobacterium nitratireducens TaxID=518897 RepID=A0A917ZL38_9GAMM|nr:HlyD family efflux transporter periplasmic adaptor subunit [Marinobacterium nitratireducens]GGO85244.1 membrane protein [Marinobacterium nitratireducens]